MATDPDETPPLHKLGFKNQGGAGEVPQAAALGLEFIAMTKARATARIPYSDKLIGNPETGVIHGGVITTLLDHVSGTAVFCALTDMKAMATLDLRIDYMRPATPGADLIAHCHCYKVTSTIAFVNGTAYHTDPEDPIATSRAVFMLTDISSMLKMSKP